MKLFTIGDSISQGFMSGAAAHTDLAYSTLIAKCMELGEYDYPEWAEGGLPINMEVILRGLEKEYGANVNPWSGSSPCVSSTGLSRRRKTTTSVERGAPTHRTPAKRSGSSTTLPSRAATSPTPGRRHQQCASR